MKARSLVPILVAAAVSALAAAGCSARQAPRQNASAQTAPPDVTRSLREFGAAGDGRADDTAAVQRALSNSDQYCLDGEGRSYRVTGTLRVTKNLCLRNVTLLQSLVPFDTTPYIRRTCPVTIDPTAVVDCGDPPIPPDQLARLRASLSVRTLFIRPAKPGDRVQVYLDRVKVDRGRYPQGGSRTDSAGIWLEGADGGSLNDVEITGYGKGVGLAVLRSANLTVTNLSIHDLVWAPYPGDTPLVQSRIETTGWNSVPIHEYREGGKGAAISKFYGVRVQEQVTCASFADVRNVSIRNPRISRCMARFQGGDLPWQADGLDISRSSSNVTVDGAQIDATWEGMDVVGNGNGVNSLVISKPQVSNSFGFGIKIGHDVHGAQVSNAVVTNAGIAGIVLYGPVDGAILSQIRVTGAGVIMVNGRAFVPWPAETHSGIVLQQGPGARGASATPRNVTVNDVTVSRAAGDPPYQFGIVNKSGNGVQVRGFHASGFTKAAAFGVSGAQ